MRSNIRCDGKSCKVLEFWMQQGPNTHFRSWCNHMFFAALFRDIVHLYVTSHTNLPWRPRPTENLMLKRQSETLEFQWGITFIDSHTMLKLRVLKTWCWWCRFLLHGPRYKNVFCVPWQVRKHVWSESSPRHRRRRRLWRLDASLIPLLKDFLRNCNKIVV